MFSVSNVQLQNHKIESITKPAHSEVITNLVCIFPFISFFDLSQSNFNKQA